VKITIRNLQKKIPVNPKRIKRAILNLLSAEGAPLTGEITVCFVTDREIKKLNKRFMRKNSPTDVLSFDLSGENSVIMADIAVSADTAMRNARVYRTTPEKEALIYVVHGVLHALGYNDSTKRDIEIMRRKESEYVN
jgi:probable rRNA maturation factor